MDAARCARFLKDPGRIGKPGVRMLDADEVRRSVEAEAAFFRQVGAQAVVIGFTLSAYLSSRVAGIPLVTSHGASYVPVILEGGLAPAPATMPIPALEWLPAWVKRRMANAISTRLTDPTAFLNDVAAELGVEPVPTLAALMLGDLTLVTDLPEVMGVAAADLDAWRPAGPAFYRPDTRLVYTGPLFAQLDLPIPPQVEAFLDGGKPTAYVVLSSSSASLLRKVTARVRSAGVLPSHRVMPRVQVAVTMGVRGSVQTAMTSGTPLVAMSLHPEQDLNVGLAARHGMALAVAPRRGDTARLTEAVHRVATNPRFAASTKRVKGWYTEWALADHGVWRTSKLLILM